MNMKISKRNPVMALVAVLMSILSFGSSQDGGPKQANWIWSQKTAGEKETAFLRKNFEVPADTKRVLLVATADNSFVAFLNGKKDRGLSGSSWEKPIVEDITSRVQIGGQNLLAIQARNDGSSAGVLVLIELLDGSGKKSRIVSDSSWQATNKGVKGWQQAGFKPSPKQWHPAVIMAKLGGGPWKGVNQGKLTALLDVKEPQATAVDRIHLADGFKAELLYSVPKSEQGSWVAMTIDNRQRLIVSDQYGALYRIQIPPPGGTVSPGDVEKIPLDIGGAWGLLYAFDSLYCVLNTSEHGGRGLYRLRDTDGDDQYDQKKLLRKFDEVGGEHGPHSVILGPDGKSLYIVCGDQTPMTKMTTSRVPRVWDEDLLMERPYGRGFMKGTLAPGGWIARTDPDGKKWELMATGFRNEYSAAFDQLGELFTYDADMEWDMNTPWYRPTRINHVTSGAEFGWRNGGGKWPAYYPDSLPAVVDIGPGSPTGVCFGYGAKFPAKYQNTFFACDWSYGKLYAVHLKPQGASYGGTFEEFMSAQPLPLTNVLVNRKDGAMYITIGGRRVQSGLYRVTYVGKESTKPAAKMTLNSDFKTRRMLEGLHKRDASAVEKAWPFLGSADRFIRFAARIAIEHQPVEEWRDKALAETDPTASINVLIALARHGDRSLQAKIITDLNRIQWKKLNRTQRIDLTRAYSLAFTRMGPGSESLRNDLAAKLSARVPAKSHEVNIELIQLLCYLQCPDAAAKGIALLKEAPSQEEQMAYAKSLRHLKTGWTRPLRRDFFAWFSRAAGYKGGASFALFVQDMKKTALSNTPEKEKKALLKVIEAKPPAKQSFTFEPLTFQKAWTLEDFDDVIHVGLEGNRDFATGRKMFGAATCFACHRFNQEGGAIGPDLTSVSGKFSPHDLLETILQPSKEISDQYGQMVFTMVDGSQVTGRIMNLSGDSVRVNTNMMNPDEIVSVDRKRVRKMEPSKLSMMPAGLLNMLTKDQVLDLMAYLLSKGNPDDPMFAR